VLVIILNRVFQRDDMMIHVVVHPVDHRCQTGRLAGTRRPRHQEQSARPLDQVPHHRGQTQLLKCQELVRNSSQHHPNHAALLEHRHAKPRFITEGKAKVRTAPLLQLLLVSLRTDTFHQVGGVVSTQFSSFQFDHASARTHHGRLTYRNVQVAHTLTHHHLKQLVDLKVSDRTR